MHSVPSENFQPIMSSVQISWKYVMNIFVQKKFYDTVQVVLVLTDQESRLRNAL